MAIVVSCRRAKHLPLRVRQSEIQNCARATPIGDVGIAQDVDFDFVDPHGHLRGCKTRASLGRHLVAVHLGYVSCGNGDGAVGGGSSCSCGGGAMPVLSLWSATRRYVVAARRW